MKLCWYDLRGVAEPDMFATEAMHQGLDAVLVSTLSDLPTLPPTITTVLFPPPGPLPDDLEAADLVIIDESHHGPIAELAPYYPDAQFGQYVSIVDPATLDLACDSARTEAWTVLDFADPTKIPLEIVLAAAAGSKGTIITVAADPQEAAVIFGVLEHGCDGVLMAPTTFGDAARLKAAAEPRTGNLTLVELAVTRVTHVGLGERACVDTCRLLRPDEGILVGSHADGLVLCVSETHPLPYMPTRPFRVNAGAIMSYTMSTVERTQYLSELRSGSQVLAVDAEGRTRTVTVGRVKIESRPLLSVDLTSADGQVVNLMLQDDWHVRVLGPGAAVLNSTELRPGDKVLGYLPTKQRHVGYPIDELCVEQ
jgi:3-amino-4-hydroxybenzoic acid synthase